jgi:hypothetical protein
VAVAFGSTVGVGLGIGVPSGMVRDWLTKMVSSPGGSSLAARMLAIETSYFSAMVLSVSPGATMWTM